MKRYIVESAIILTFGFMLFSFGAGLFPRVVEIPVEVLVMAEMSKPKTITKLVTLPPRVVFSNDFKYFTSYAELRAWLDSVEPEMRIVSQAGWTCQNYAWWLFERAIEDGYLMAKYGMRAESYNAAFGYQVDGPIAINATFINDHTYLIQSQDLRVFPDFEIEASY